MRILKVAFIITILCAGFTACEKKDDGSDNGGNQSSFDRKRMLQNMGTNIIIPNYQNFNKKANALNNAATQFTSNVTEVNLDSLQSKFLTAYKAWQKVTAYGFGPAKQMALRNNINTFPADTSGIEKRIRNNNQNWGPYDNDLKGFPALDYLLYQHNDQQKTLDSFKNNSNRKSYLTAITQEIKNMSEQVLSGWQSSGDNYLKAFVNATGNDKGSSLGLLVNELNFDWEIIKNDKIGIPLGKKSINKTFPGKVEAYYSKNSLKLMIANMNAIENLFLGRHNGTNGKGLDDHLDAANAKRNGQQLSEVIEEQFSTARTKLKNLNSPLSAAIVNNKSKVNEAYQEVQKQVVFLKTDMPSALGVRITYQDNDGD